MWLAADAPELSDAAKAACTDPANDVFLSSISGWEIAIKYGLGRIALPEPPQAYVPGRRRWMRLDPLEFDELAATHTHLLPAHHRDPFDRALVAQAITRGLSIVTPDPLVTAYPAPTLW